MLIPGWIALRKIGNSSLAKATIFMPIVGYFVIFNDELVKYLQILESLAGKAASDDHGLTRLLSVYIGLFFVGVASIVFLFFCPPELAETASEYEFSQKEMDIMNPERVTKTKNQLKEMKKKALKSRYADIDRLSEVAMSETVTSFGGSAPLLAWPDWIARNKGNISAVVALKYAILNEARFLVRVICTSCYAVGFLFLFFPSAHVFMHAFGLLISRLLPTVFG